MYTDNANDFLSTNKRIHQNPFKAGISKVDSCPWSSYNAYVQGDGFVDTEKALEMLNGKDGFIEFVIKEDASNCLDIVETHRLTDEKAIEIIRKIAKIQNAQAIQNFDLVKRNKVLHALKEQGISIRQLSRLTGINRGIVLKA